MTYVDGFVIPIPKTKVAAYKRMARLGLKMWMKGGALDYKECVADDLKAMSAPGCKSFAKVFKLKKNETAVFAYIVFKSRAHRDAVNKKVMKLMEKQPAPKDMPFNMARVLYGGFRTIVE